MVINANRSADNLQNAAVSLTQPRAKLAVSPPVNSTEASNSLSTLDSQFSGISAAQESVASALSLTQTQSGILHNVGKALHQMSQLASSAQDANSTDTDRASANQEFQALSAYITNAASQTFNGVSLFSGAAMSVDTDGNGAATTLDGINLQNPAYIAAAASDISTLQGPPATGATGALAAVQAALKQLSSDSAITGANHSTLASTADQLAVSSENLSAANFNLNSQSAADQSLAAATAAMLSQPASTLLMQATQIPQSVLQLLEV